MEILGDVPLKACPFSISMASQESKICSIITCLKNTVMLSVVFMWGVLCKSLEGN